QPSSSVSSVLGKEISETNTGSLRNQGWEFELNYNKKWNDFNLAVSPNFTVVNNKVLDLGVGNINQKNGIVGNGEDLFVGYPMEVYYGYQDDGLYIDEEDIANGPDVSSINPEPQPGDIKYKDINGPDEEKDGMVNSSYDKKV